MDPYTINPVEVVDNYLDDHDWQVKENSNAPKSVGSLTKYLSSEIAKKYWLSKVYSPDPRIAYAYNQGYFHIHDLGVLSVYCCGYSLENILRKGVRGVPNIPVSSPAKHFDSILNQISNLATLYQNEIAGAVAFSSIDTLLAPFIRVDNLGYKEVKQSLQNFIYSINSNSRAGAEPAFTNVTLDLTPPDDLAVKNAIIGGVEHPDIKYGDCQDEMDLFNRAFCELLLKGDSEGNPFAYPIPTYNIHKQFDWGNPNHDILWEMTGLYGYPYFANFINSDMKASDTRSMCPLRGDTMIPIKESPESEVQVVPIREINNREVYVKYGEEWKLARGNRSESQSLIRVKSECGEYFLGEFHEQLIVRGDRMITVPAGSILSGDYLVKEESGIRNLYKVVDLEYLTVSDDLYCAEVL